MTPDTDHDEVLRLRGEVARLRALTDRQTHDLAALVRLSEDRRFPGLAARRFWRSLRPRLGVLRLRASRFVYRLLGTGLPRVRDRFARSRARLLPGPRR